MSDILLTKPKLPNGFIDVSIGEAHIIKESLFKTFDCSCYTLPQVPHMYEYPDARGYEPLVRLLEEKHKAPVIITNGAKQALGACFYALKQLDKAAVRMRVPYWALIPPLLEMHGCISASTMQDPPHYSDSEFWKHESHLYLGPNNPDGFIHSAQDLIEMDKGSKEAGCPFIHDAVYYTRAYMPDSHSLPAVGDVHIYSISKMLGLSGLRLGYAVCPNPVFYKLIHRYMEAMTVGASILSQVFAYDLMDRMRSYPTLTSQFEWLAYESLQKSKEIFSTVDPAVITLPKDFLKTPGMFAFVKCPMYVMDKAKINAVDGCHFGMPGYVRINLAFPEDTMQEIVKRLNATKE